MEISGKILELQGEQIISAKFRKRSMILETTEDQYPQTFEIEFTQDRGALLDKWSVGQNVLVSINLRGRKWTPPEGGDDRYFSAIQGWRIQAANAGGDSSPGPGGFGPQPGPGGNDDDIPF